MPAPNKENFMSSIQSKISRHAKKQKKRSILRKKSKLTQTDTNDRINRQRDEKNITVFYIFKIETWKVYFKGPNGTSGGRLPCVK